MSSSIALRRSPKPGAFTAATLRPPRSLLTTSVASASPSTSSAMISSGLPLCTTASSTGSSGCRPDELLLVDQDVRAFQLADHLLGVGDEVRREVAAVELHALDDVELGLEALRLLDRDDAFLADLLHRVGDHLADLAVAVRRDRADLRDLLVGRDLLRALLEVLDHRLDGDVDAALQVHRVHARGHRLGALAHDRLRQHRRGRRAVAGLVGGLAGDLACTICAPMFSNLSESSISLATVTPSLVMRGAPKLLSSTTLRPFGPSVTFTASARMSTPRSIRSRGRRRRTVLL